MQVKFLWSHLSDNSHTWMWHAVSFAANTVSVQLKTTETSEQNYAGVVKSERMVGLHCPVSSLRKLASLRTKKHPNQPVFMFSSGSYLIREGLTQILRTAVGKRK